MKALTLAPVPVRSKVLMLILLAIPWSVVFVVLFQLNAAQVNTRLALSSIVIICAIISAVDGLILLAVLKNNVFETSQSLCLRVMALLRYELKFNDVDWPQARWVDLRQEKALRFRWRTFGMGLPGYQAGYFRLRGGVKCFALCRGSQVLYLPKRDGQVVMVSLQDGARWLKQKQAVFMQ